MADYQCNNCWGTCHISRRRFSGMITVYEHFFSQFRSFLWSGSHIVIWKPPLDLLKTSLASFYEMQSGWLLPDVTAAEAPARAESGLLWLILDVVWPIQATSVVREPHCYLKIPLLSPSSLSLPTYGHLLNIFTTSWATFVVGEPLCDLEIPSWHLKSYLGPFNENRVVDYWCNSCRSPARADSHLFGYFRHFWPTQAAFCTSGIHFVIWKSPFEP